MEVDEAKGAAAAAAAGDAAGATAARAEELQREAFMAAFARLVAQGVPRNQAAALAIRELAAADKGDNKGNDDGDDDVKDVGDKVQSAGSAGGEASAVEAEDDAGEQENGHGVGADPNEAAEGAAASSSSQEVADDVSMADANEKEQDQEKETPAPSGNAGASSSTAAAMPTPAPAWAPAPAPAAATEASTEPAKEPADDPISGKVFSLAELNDLVRAVESDESAAPGEALRPLIRRVGAVFCDPLHLIAAFRTGNEEPDLSAAAQVFQTLATVKDEEGLVDNALRTALRGLASQLSYPFTRSNKRRIIPSLVALEYEAFQYDPDLLTTESNLLKALTKGPSASLEHLRWFLRNRCSDEYLVRLVMQTQMYITLAATMGADSGAEVNYSYLEEAVILMSELHAANEAAEAPFIEDYTDFYNSAVNELATEDEYFLREDLRAWIKEHYDEQGNLKPDDGRSKPSSFCDNAFMLDPGSKARLLQLEARVQQYMQRGSLRATRMRNMLPIFALRVRREHLVDDVMDIIAQSEPEEFKRSLRVEFVGEEGVDEGGVQKEFFLLMVRQLLDPNFGMFSMDEDSRKLWFNPSTFEPSIKFELVGVILGLAIFNGVILDLTFPSAMYKKLLGVTPTLEDLKDLSPQLAKGLEDLLAFNGDAEATFCRNFQVSYEAFGEIKTVDLVPDGANKPVTNANREEYVRLYVDYQFNRSVEHLFRPFHKGFYLVCENTFLRLFKPDEMELLLCGNTSDKLDFADLRSSCRYEGYQDDSPEIELFWSVVSDFSEEQKKKFLQFTTGSDRIPIRGLRSLQLTISKNNNAKQLPTSSTCFNYLILPAYTTRDELESKLLLAIDHAEGFGTM